MNALFDVNKIRLETSRLLLRPWELTDLDDFYEYASTKGVGENAGWLPHENKEKSLEVLNRFISGRKTFAIVYKENNKVIGSLGVELYNLEDKLLEFKNLNGRSIGYVLSKDYWNKGIMTEAVKRVIDYLFNELNYDFLLCGRFDFNVRSGRVQEKCGFKPYRKLVFDTHLGTKEKGVLSLLLNPKKNIELDYSHPETLLMNYKLLKSEFFKQKDAKYAEFSKSLANSDYEFIGVRSPILKDFIKRHYDDFTLDFENFELGKYFEIDTFYFISHIKRLNTLKEQLDYIAKNSRYMLGWSVTDTCPQYLKNINYEEYESFYLKTYNSKYTYTRRVAYVIGLKIVRDRRILNLLDKFTLNEEYMVMMGEAWLLATIAIIYPLEVLDYLKSIDDKVLIRKTISKIVESYRVKEEYKNLFKQLRETL